MDKAFIEQGFDNKTLYVLMPFILAESYASSLLNRNYTIKMVNNTTRRNFITSDNPVINLINQENLNEKLYMPISPKKAIYLEQSKIALNDKNRHILESVNATKEEILVLNERIWERKERFIFALEKQDLEHKLTFNVE